MSYYKPATPLLVYDGDCAFCRIWIEYFRYLTVDRVVYVSYQEVSERYPELKPDQNKKSVQLFTPEGQIYEGAEAIFRLLKSAPGKAWLLWLYDNIPGFSFVSELFYRLVARHRGLSFKINLILWGRSVAPHSFFLSRWIFVRLLGVIYFIAFFSFWRQLPGLIGSNGILPSEIFLGAVKIHLGTIAYFQFPTLAWVNDSDRFLKFIPIAGMLFSTLIVVGILSVPSLIMIWLLYLSLVTIGQDFMSFQWDALLLETGFLAIFLAPLGVYSKTSKESQPSSIVIWLFWFLLFRLIFSSGIGKLTTGDPTWRDFTALNFHYYTQPLPTPIAWYMHQLPEWVQKISVGFIFFIEILIPFLVFAPRRIRFLAGGGIIVLQLTIFLTGNYTFFNLLTIALCVLLFDDSFFNAFLPSNLRCEPIRKGISDRTGWLFNLKKTFLVSLAVLIVFLGAVHLGKIVFRYRYLPQGLQNVLQWVVPFRIVNSYGLFTVMTTSRPEIIIEGSYDGKNWLEYEFRYKPGNPQRPLPWVAPDQPRLDWQMWFAALGNYRSNPWFSNLMLQILQGSPDVLSLLEENPFPNKSPKYVRAVVYDYKFTDFATRRQTGEWWKREFKGLYLPIISLGN